MQVKTLKTVKGIPEANAAVSGAEEPDGSKRVIAHVSAIDSFDMSSVVATLRMSPVEALDFAERLRKAAEALL